MPDTPPLDYAPKPAKPAWIRDDFAYILPMLVFLLLTAAAGKWPDAYPAIYLAKTILTAVALILLWKNFTPIRWNHWWLGLILLGIAGDFSMGGNAALVAKSLFAFFRPSSGDAFNPLKYFHDVGMRDAFIAVRLIGAVLVVPVMEELFWRDFLWRQILAPNDFKLAQVGEWAWGPFLIVAIAFLHGARQLVADGDRVGADDRGAAGLHEKPGGVHHYACDDQFAFGTIRAAHARLVVLVSHQPDNPARRNRHILPIFLSVLTPTGPTTDTNVGRGGDVSFRRLNRCRWEDHVAGKIFDVDHLARAVGGGTAIFFRLLVRGCCDRSGAGAEKPENRRRPRRGGREETR